MGWGGRKNNILGLILIIFLTTAWSRDSVQVFSDLVIGFDTTIVDGFEKDGIKYYQQGQRMEKTVKLPGVTAQTKITATLHVEKFYDDMDRLGNVHLKLVDGTRVELIHYITSFGGKTDHPEDVSYLAPLLQGDATICIYLDMWRTSAFKAGLKIIFEENSTQTNPKDVKPLFYFTNLVPANLTPTKPSKTVSIPAGTQQVIMTYFTSGHGVYGNEFQTCPNVLYADNKEIFRTSPWRDDCAQYKDINPAAWQSESYKWSRSGWCPGAPVHPSRVDLKNTLAPGQHTFSLDLPGISTQFDTRWGIAAFLSCYGDIVTPVVKANGSETNTQPRIWVANHFLKITLPGAMRSYTMISLIDMQGRARTIPLQGFQDSRQQEMTVDLNSFIKSSGVYFIRMSAGNNSFIRGFAFMNR
jgi:hypothetical protein